MAITAEAVNADVKALRSDLHKLEVGIAEIRTELKVLVGVAKWGVGIIASTLVSSTGLGIWWASGITSEVRHLQSEVAEVRKASVEQGAMIASLSRLRLDEHRQEVTFPVPPSPTDPKDLPEPIKPK